MVGLQQRVLYLKTFFSCRRTEHLFNCTLLQTERMAQHSAWEYRNKINLKPACDPCTQVILSVYVLLLTTKSGHSVKSQSPAGQSAAHFTLRNSPRPKGITKLVRERGYCPHLVHVELQQSIILVPYCSKNGLSLGPHMTNLTFSFSQNNSNWL